MDKLKQMTSVQMELSAAKVGLTAHSHTTTKL